MNQTLAIAAGGAIGALMRFWMSTGIYALLGRGFPYGTLAVNVMGCLLIGFLGGLVDFRGVLDPQQRLFLIVGVLGGFTTFSTFAFETLMLAQDAAVFRAAANIVAQVVIGIVAAMIGYVGARLI